MAEAGTLRRQTTVMLGTPTHDGRVAFQTVHAIMDSAGPDLILRVALTQSSLLGVTFSQLFAKAYLMGADYFCMIHSDIGCRPATITSSQTSWLQIMVDELNKYKLAALAAIPMIKSNDGHTSTGMQLFKTNSFTLRRVMSKELKKLPMVFGRDDLCALWKLDPATAGAMYINTGCLLIDLKRFPWAQRRFPGFDMRSAMAWTTDGFPRTFCLPEDWNFSKWLTTQGWPYMATRSVHITHVGPTVFANFIEYGLEEDVEGPKNPSFSEQEAASALGGKIMLLENTTSEQEYGIPHK